MTDIDLTEAVEEAAKSIMSEYEDGLPSWRDLDSQGQTWYRGIAKGALEAALPLILAQVEARVTPSRDDIVQALINSDIIASDTRANAQIVGHNDREPFLCFADSVLALLPGKTEQEVREEVAREHEEKMDRLFEGEWQAGYVAGNNDQLNGTICGRRRAANEGIARGGEQND